MTIGEKSKENWELKLLDACFHNNLEKVNLLFSPEYKGFRNLNFSNENSSSDNLLLVCAYVGAFEILKLLLTSPELTEHADINYKRHNGENTLLIACKWGYLEIVKYLLTSPELKNHSSINGKDNKGNNILISACESENLELVKYLVEDSLFKNYWDEKQVNDDGDNLLMLAGNRANQTIIEYLIDEQNIISIDLSHRNKKGEDILLYLCNLIYGERNGVFKGLYVKRNKHIFENLIKYFLFDKNLNLSDYNLEYFENNKYNDVLALIRKKELKNKLNNVLKTDSQHKLKKI